MRINNTIKNIYVGFISQIVIVLLGFISRKIFIDNLGTEYLGVNGLLTNILSMMSLVEGGIGISITYNLYKPLAENDSMRVTALIQLYKKIYLAISLIIFVIGILLYPFLDIFINGADKVKCIGLVYFLFLFKNIISYLNGHKWSLINADQKAYVLVKCGIIFNTVNTILKIIILYFTKSYILYLVIEIIVFIFENLWNGKIVNERYPYLKTANKYIVDVATKKEMIKNCKALFLHKIGSWCVFGTDNIIISTFISTVTVGIYSNYTMIINQLNALIRPIITGISSSVGNLIVLESKDKQYSIFKVVNLIGFWIYSLATILLYNLINPFIDWWLGKGLLLDKGCIYVVLLNFYIMGMREAINIFKFKGGIFAQDRYAAIIESIVNLLVSIFLVKKIGLIGVFIGTTVSSLVVPVWLQSFLVYKNIFNKSVSKYYKKYLYYTFIAVCVTAITAFLCNSILINGFIGLVVKGMVCFLIVNIIYILTFKKTEEFKYLVKIGEIILKGKFRS